MADQIIITILSAFLPITLTTIIAWLERRGQVAQLHRLLDFAQKRVQFLNAFLTTQSMATTPEQFDIIKRSVAKEVILIRVDLLKSIEQTNIINDKSKYNKVLQTFFLLYKIDGILSRISRFLFYTFLAFPIIGALGIINLLFDSRSTISLPGTIITAILGSIVYMLPALLFRWLAIVTDRRSYDESTKKQE